MASKIVLFVSILQTGRAEKKYSAPNGKKYTGLQTNEAPVQYLLEAHPEISEIICVVTKEAQQAAERRENAWEQFQKTIIACWNKQPKKINWETEETEEGFERDILPKLLEQIETNDTIYLETSGGKRDNVMYLTLLSRVLTYKGVTIGQAVYSDFQKDQIKDITDQYKLFDLIDGMQNMASFGNVGKLREYFGNSAEDKLIENLLSAMENMFENITLCRTSNIDSSVEKFNEALKEAEKCENPLMRQLLPAFRKKFGKDKKLTIPRLIRWCVDSDMVQQALTVYTERIPAYIMTVIDNDTKGVDRSKPLQVTKEEFNRVKPNKDNNDENKKNREYRDDYLVVFMDGFLMLSKDDEEYKDIRIRTLKNLKYYMTGSSYTTAYNVNQLHQIALDYLFLKDVRNMTNHANIESKATEDRLNYYEKNGYPDINNMSMKKLKEFIEEAVEHLKNRKKK